MLCLAIYIPTSVAGRTKPLYTRLLSSYVGLSSMVRGMRHLSAGSPDKLLISILVAGDLIRVLHIDRHIISAKAEFEAWQEGVVWVELGATLKVFGLLPYPLAHQIRTSVVVVLT